VSGVSPLSLDESAQSSVGASCVMPCGALNAARMLQYSIPSPLGNSAMALEISQVKYFVVKSR
jgi:hypothetical protein